MSYGSTRRRRYGKYDKHKRNRRDTVKQFVVDTEKTGCRNHSEALKYFHKWRNRYYNDEIEVLRVKSAKSYIIFYRVKPKGQTRLTN